MTLWRWRRRGSSGWWWTGILKLERKQNYVIGDVFDPLETGSKDGPLTNPVGGPWDDLPQLSRQEEPDDTWMNALAQEKTEDVLVWCDQYR